MGYIGRVLSFAAIPIVILGLLGSLGSCGSERREPTVSRYEDHEEWSRQMREIEMQKYEEGRY